MGNLELYENSEFIVFFRMANKTNYLAIRHHLWFFKIICNTLSSYYQASRASANLRSVAESLTFVQKFNFDKNQFIWIFMPKFKIQVNLLAKVNFWNLDFLDLKGMFGTVCAMRVTISFNSRPSSSFTTAAANCPNSGISFELSLSLIRTWKIIRRESIIPVL